MRKISFSSSGWHDPRCPFCCNGECRDNEQLKGEKGIAICDNCGKEFYYEAHTQRVSYQEVTYSTSKLDKYGNPETYESEVE